MSNEPNDADDGTEPKPPVEFTTATDLYGRSESPDLAERVRCHFCGELWKESIADGFDLSADDEYYPKMVPVCPAHAGGCR